MRFAPAFCTCLFALTIVAHADPPPRASVPRSDTPTKVSEIDHLRLSELTLKVQLLETKIRVMQEQIAAAKVEIERLNQRRAESIKTFLDTYKINPQTGDSYDTDSASPTYLNITRNKDGRK